MSEQQTLWALDGDLTTVAKGAGIAFIGKASGTGFKYLTQVVLARFLGPALFGIFALGMVVYEVTELFSSMGLVAGAVRYVAIHHGSEDLQRLKGVIIQVIWLPFLGGGILGAVIFLASDIIAQDIFGKPALAIVLRILAIALPFWASTIVAARATTGFQTTKYLVYIKEFIQPLANLFLVALLCFIGLKLLGATLAWVLSFVLGFAAIFYFIKKVFPPVFEKSVKPVFETRELLKFSLPLAIGDLFLFFFLRIDILMVGYFLASSEVGVYRAASQTALLLLIFLTSFNYIFAPLIADVFKKGDEERMRQLFKTVTRWSFSLTLPIFLIVGIGAENILRLFGSGFSPGWLPLVILGAGQLVNAGSGGVALMLIMSGHQYHKLFGDLVAVALNLVLNLTLIPRWGIVGAAVAAGTSIAGVNLMRIIQVYFILRVHAYNWHYLKVVGVGLVAALGGLAVKNFIHVGHFLLSILLIAVMVILVYVPLFWRICLEETDRIVLTKIKEKLI
jgi:O-antigen/teichoic acid export membrane protein